MKPFKWMFEEQNATEIEYKGKQVSSFYRYDKKGKYRLKFTFVSTNSFGFTATILIGMMTLTI